MFSCSCDTMVAMSNVTADGSIIFGKNSDRQANEPLSTRYIPSTTHILNSKIRTTYIEIDQVEETHSCILFCPTNKFGAEMGFNSHGVVIGNEALFTKIPSYSEGLTGMDIVRLVLERCSTSRQGKDTIVYLLNKYGQGGNCGFTSKFYYHNSFLVVDSNEGWIIETVGREYAAKRITKGIHTISNIISFGHIDTFDEYSDNLIQQAISNGWCSSIDDFHFQKCYSGISFNPKEFYNGFVKTSFASSQIRQCRSRDLIEKFSQKSQQFTPFDMFNVLRDHQLSNDSPAQGLTNLDLCMHAGFGPIRFNQTTGSLVSVLPKSYNELPVHYATCTALPCLSIFKPMTLYPPVLPPPFISYSDSIISNPTCTYSSNNVWWKSEIMTRNVMKHYQKLIKQIETERDLLEREFVSMSLRLSSRYISQTDRNNYTKYAFDKADILTNEWFSRAYSLSFEVESELSFWQELTWNQWRKSAEIPKHMVTYSKIQIRREILFVMCLLLILYYFKNDNQQFFILLFIFSKIYLFIRRVLFYKTNPNPEQRHLTLPRLNFYD
ncbi:unnamed protein product [Rotaria socialis]|uniref:Dipeptidase n=3 Tax=Rotaria socialis TaxID=392032 RepID=A0A818A2L4_9BILA|nr:unnamed protein product [Rotaria socialis]CAF4346896.1 unnamed protein product [Rotaria socialis]